MILINLNLIILNIIKINYVTLKVCINFYKYLFKTKNFINSNLKMSNQKCSKCGNQLIFLQSSKKIICRSCGKIHNQQIEDQPSSFSEKIYPQFQSHHQEKSNNQSLISKFKSRLIIISIVLPLSIFINYFNHNRIENNMRILRNGYQVKDLGSVAGSPNIYIKSINNIDMGNMQKEILLPKGKYTIKLRYMLTEEKILHKTHSSAEASMTVNIKPRENIRFTGTIKGDKVIFNKINY